MQNLDVISINLWEIIISLANLIIVYLILKKVLFKKIKAVLAARQAEVSAQYNAADAANHEALNNKKEWEEKMLSAESEAQEIIKDATQKADRRANAIISDAKDNADDIMARAKNEIELERKKNEAGIKNEIIETGAVLSEKILKREIKDTDHRDLISSFIEDLGEGDE
ncbi:MAG TPA: F0F1 ATP synthase subunit B [Clostridiales bacterium]|nr:F0F1 ATP synthase subunit B [Clostridiales bacterium]